MVCVPVGSILILEDYYGEQPCLRRSPITYTKKGMRANEMDQWVKVLAVISEDLSLIPGPTWKKRASF